MNWTELVHATATRLDRRPDEVRRVLTTAIDVLLEALADGDTITLHRLGTLGTRLAKGRVMRSVADRRKLKIGDRYLVRFRPAAAARRAAASRLPQHWRDPQHQAAWRLAETLVADLDLYHTDRAPRLPEGLSDRATRAACTEAFGSLWARVEASWDKGVPADVTTHHDHLADAARHRWAAEEPA